MKASWKSIASMFKPYAKRLGKVNMFGYKHIPNAFSNIQKGLKVNTSPVKGLLP